MRALICAASVLGLLTVVALTSRPAGAQDDEKPTIKQIMVKLHKGAKAPLSAVKAQLKKDSPDWDQVETEAKIIEKYGAFLTKTEAPRGDQASYGKLAKAYLSSSKDLDHAAEEKDLDKARAALRKLGGSCQGCHKAHRPPQR
jgi:cytochrome c556